MCINIYIYIYIYICIYIYIQYMFIDVCQFFSIFDLYVPFGNLTLPLK